MSHPQRTTEALLTDLLGVDSVTGLPAPQKSTNGAAHVTQRASGSVFASGALANTTPVILSMEGAPIPATVWVVPGTGDTVKVEYSMDGGTTYTTWPNGSVTTSDSDILLSAITYLKFTATTDVTHTSTYGVC